jgi:hypothetical protein
VRERGLERDLAVDFLVVEVGRRRPVIDPTHTVDGPCDEQQGGHQ